MRTLSKIIIACTALVCTLSSCKKSNVSPKLSVESIVFTINGTKHTLTSNVVEHKAIYEGVPQFISTQISASSLQNREDMTLYINHTDSLLKEGTYLATNSNIQGNATLVYHNENGYSYIIQNYTNPNCTITITEIGSNYMKGTFSAVLSGLPPAGSPSVPDITITNGEFYAKTPPLN
jgi:hypothetical protein